MGCGCGSKRTINKKPGSTLTSSGNFPEASRAISEEEIVDQMVNVEYLGPNEQNFTIRSKVKPSQTYRFGNNPYNRIKTVYLRDALYLTARLLPDGSPEYVMVTGATMEQRDPSAFIGQVSS